MLAWLAPEGDEPVAIVPVADTGAQYPVENGIRGRGEIMKELDKAAEIIHQHAPDRLTILGGDCLVDLEPFAWLSERWGEGFGILWIDTHPDVMTPAQYENAHAHVLGALMGNGDEALTRRVKRPVPSSRVFIAGLHGENEYETNFITRHRIQTCLPEEVQQKTSRIAEWIKKEKITHLAIHFDLDVLDYHQFRAVMFARTDKDAPSWDGVAKGRLSMDDVMFIIQEAESATDIVGLGIAEHLPWDAINLKNMLAQLPLLRGD
ncbi:arginase family protein [Photorhabdus sp. CRCIA-P01]|uniref:arginase family protein n=1 Tax=Photorhabdus sp. CRCIA-P01 TaxID=2019570 RepID=UPI001E34C498|nr:arginase family protein [Photorhabdus sp. CRCIA-P01]